MSVAYQQRKKAKKKGMALNGKKNKRGVHNVRHIKTGS